MKRSVVYTILIFFSCLCIQAQSPVFYLGFDHILDNREYFARYAEHQTIFGARINPGIAFTFDSAHSVCAGINYMYEYGGELLGVDPQLDLYYSYSRSGVKIFFGSFPRRELTDYPLMLLTDSLDYYRPNIEGSSISYSWEWGSVHGWVDWTGRASEETRESILAGIDATFNTGMFRFTAITTRYHLAGRDDPADRDRIRDDGSVMALAGADLSDRLILEHMELSTGMVSTYEWLRPDENRWFAGWFSRLDLKHSLFGIRGIYYLGNPSPLHYGDYLYRSGNYGRLDLYVDPFRNRRISSKIGWNFHFLIGERTVHSQQILIRVSL